MFFIVQERAIKLSLILEKVERLVEMLEVFTGIFLIRACPPEVIFKFSSF